MSPFQANWRGGKDRGWRELRRWFAWCPVAIPGWWAPTREQWIWWEWVERRQIKPSIIADDPDVWQNRLLAK